MKNIENTMWENELDYHLQQLHGAVVSYETAKAMDRENLLRPLAEQTDISKLTLKDATRHTENIDRKYNDLKQFISKTISQEREKMIEEINKLESENWQDTYEAGFEDAKEIIINLLQNK